MREELVKQARHRRRRMRIRKKVRGTAQRPRLAVARSHRHIEAQLIDDLAGRTMCAASSRRAELREQCSYGGNTQAAVAVGKALGEEARALGIEQVCFDRGGRKYHGRVKALADAAREAGLEF
jgi:large subunit ribosomal protein L18